MLFNFYGLNISLPEDLNTIKLIPNALKKGNKSAKCDLEYEELNPCFISTNELIKLDLKYGEINKPKLYNSQIINGNKIKYCFNDKFCDLQKIQLLLTHPLAFAGFQRNECIVHASAVNVNNKAILFLGRSGSGKSFHALNTLKFGQFITEDIARIKIIENQAYIYPGIPLLKLDIDDHKISDTRIKLKNDNRGRYLYLLKDFDYKFEPVKIDKLIVLDNSSVDKIYRISKDLAFKYLFLSIISPLPKMKCLESEKQFLDNIESLLLSTEIYKLDRNLFNSKNKSEHIFKKFIETVVN